MNYDLIIYHKSCQDGLASVFPFWLKDENKSVEYYPEFHGNSKFPPCKNKKVLCLDFSYPYDIVKKMLEEVISLTIIDHHAKSVDLIPLLSHPRMTGSILDLSSPANTKAGCELSWLHVFPERKIPFFVNSIAKRDIWRETEEDKVISNYLYETGLTKTLEDMKKLLETDDNCEEKAYEFGHLLMDIKNRKIEAVCKQAFLCKLDNKYRVLLCPCEGELRSDVGNKLAFTLDTSSLERKYLCDFSVTYRYDFRSDTFWLSLRGRGDFDLNHIANSIWKNSGGHKSASGASCLDKLQKYFQPI